MPRGDRTGPAGAGPMTGRAAGFCAGNSVPGYMSGGFGRGMGFGRGFGHGMGFGHGFGRGTGFGRGFFGFGGGYAYPHVTAVNEKELLQNEASALENELTAVKKRLSELEKPESK